MDSILACEEVFRGLLLYESIDPQLPTPSYYSESDPFGISINGTNGFVV